MGLHSPFPTAVYTVLFTPSSRTEMFNNDVVAFEFSRQLPRASQDRPPGHVLRFAGNQLFAPRLLTSSTWLGIASACPSKLAHLNTALSIIQSPGLSFRNVKSAVLDIVLVEPCDLISYVWRHVTLAAPLSTGPCLQSSNETWIDSATLNVVFQELRSLSEMCGYTCLSWSGSLSRIAPTYASSKSRIRRSSSTLGALSTGVGGGEEAVAVSGAAAGGVVSFGNSAVNSSLDPATRV